MADRRPRAGPAAVTAAALALRRFGSGRRGRSAAAALLTAGPELGRLGALPAPWPQRLHHADVNVIMAIAVGLLAATAGLIALGKKSAQTAGVERARSDAFGHADLMSMTEARRLFDASRSSLGGVVIGEAYRVDQDRVAAIPFDPRQPATWGRGGKAPLLVFAGATSTTPDNATGGNGAKRRL